MSKLTVSMVVVVSVDLLYVVIKVKMIGNKWQRMFSEEDVDTS